MAEKPSPRTTYRIAETMDHSTEGVTLLAVFISDVLKNYQPNREDYEELFAKVKGMDLSDPNRMVPMQIYNDLCQWIEDNLGKFNLIQVGRNVGETAFAAMVAEGLINEDTATPIEVLQGIQAASKTMIHDPKGRGWEILDKGDHYIIMRRTQTFNSKLQLGLLSGLVRKTNVSGVNVDYERRLEDGADFDDYRISWM
ncbi:MAG: hypothetical protein AAFQ98_25960 [Bacteroidota bacterium]